MCQIYIINFNDERSVWLASNTVEYAYMEYTQYMELCVTYMECTLNVSRPGQVSDLIFNVMCKIWVLTSFLFFQNSEKNTKNNDKTNTKKKIIITKLIVHIFCGRGLRPLFQSGAMWEKILLILILISEFWLFCFRIPRKASYTFI